MRILLVGAGGFIGSNLIERIVSMDNSWYIEAIDINSEKISEFMGNSRVNYTNLNILLDKNKICDIIKSVDVVLPFAAIANPKIYVEDPIRVFELDFEANLHIVKLCVEYCKRLIFPSTSEVYGMCADEAFDEFTSNCVTGPICKQRWIYSASKQLLDRVIYAYGEKGGLDYTLFRPFNWIGPRLDDVRNRDSGSSRVLTQFISNIMSEKDIELVDGGLQQRSFTYISDGIDALIKILENKNNCATKQIFNIGNPSNLVSIKELAELLLRVCKKNQSLCEKAKKVTVKSVKSDVYYGGSYQDIERRVPSIANAKNILGWEPKITLSDAIEKTINFYF